MVCVCRYQLLLRSVFSLTNYDWEELLIFPICLLPYTTMIVREETSKDDNNMYLL